MRTDWMPVERRITGMLYVGLGLWLALLLVQALCLPFDGYVIPHVRAEGGTVAIGPWINRVLLEAVDRLFSYRTVLVTYGGLLVVVSLYSSALIAWVMNAKDVTLEALRRPLSLVWLVLAVCTIFNFTYLSNDLYLYRLYGQMVNVLHLNPYDAVPIEQFSADNIVNVPWTDQNAAYGPAALFVFGLTSRIAGGIVAQFWLMKSALVLPWVAILLALAMSKGIGKATKLRSMAWIGLSPVLLLEVCQNGHLEGWIGFLFLGAVLVLDKVSYPRIAAAGLLFGLACAVKLTALVALAAIAVHILLSRRAMRDSWKDGALASAVFGLTALITLAACYGPFWVGIETFDGLRVESDKVLRSIFALLRDQLGVGSTWIRGLALLGLVTACASGALTYWKRRRLSEAIVVSLAIQAYLGRTFFQPWYLAAMIFVAVAPRLLDARDAGADSTRLSRVERALLVAGAFAIAGSYTGMIVTQSRSENVLLTSTFAIVLLPPIVLWVGDAWHARRQELSDSAS